MKATPEPTGNTRQPWRRRNRPNHWKISSAIFGYMLKTLLWQRPGGVEPSKSVQTLENLQCHIHLIGKTYSAKPVPYSIPYFLHSAKFIPENKTFFLIQIFNFVIQFGTVQKIRYGIWHWFGAICFPNRGNMALEISQRLDRFPLRHAARALPQRRFEH